MPRVESSYALSRKMELSFEDAVARVRAELDGEAFTVRCEIDVQARLKKGLGMEREPCVIIGACNPALADRASRDGARCSVAL